MRWFNADNKKLVVIKNDEEILGFLAYSFKKEQFEDDFSTYLKGLFKSKVIKNPMLVFRVDIAKIFLRWLRYKKHKPIEYQRTATINTIGVDVTKRLTGIATKLLDYIEQDLRTKGIQKLRLSVQESNKSALNFYMARGFSVYQSIGSELKMIKNIKNE